MTGRLNLSNAVQASERIRLSGQEFYQPANTSTEGVSLLLGVNRSANHQLWIAGSDALTQNSTNPVFRILPNNSSVTLSALATNGTVLLPMTIEGSAISLGGFSRSLTGMRIEGNTNSSSGEGLELRYDSGSNVGYVVPVDRTGAVNVRLVVQGEELDLYGGTAGVRFQDVGTTSSAPNTYLDTSNGNRILRTSYTFGSAATQNTGTSGTNVPLLDGANTWSSNQTFQNSALSTSASAGMGYGIGAGGAVTQLTSKATAVTLNKISGAVTMNGAALAASTSVSFTLNNTTIAATDVVVVNIKSGASANSYLIAIDAVAAGSARIHVRNVSGGSLSQALVLNFVVIKGVAS